MPIKPRVKICCISSIEEARLAIKYGVSALGLVSAMPSGPGVITEEKIGQIVSLIPPGVASFLLTSRQNIDEIIEQQKRLKVNTIQIVDTLISGTHRQLKDALPGISVVQVIHVTDYSSIQEAVKISKDVDAVLLDSGNQKLAVKELGGTGRTHDWNLSRKIVDELEVPVFLAGGLNPENVRDAVEKVRPYGVDICSGVRTDGKLDESKLSAFFAQLENL